MATYTVTHSLISGAVTPTFVVTFSPTMALTASQPGARPNYFIYGDVVTDDDLAPIAAPHVGSLSSASISDIWRWSNQTVPPTNRGMVRNDTGDWSNAATTLWITRTTDANLDVTQALAQVKSGSTIVLAQTTDPSRYVQYLTTADALDSGGMYLTFAVAYQASGGKIPNSSTQITVSIYPPNSGGPPPDSGGPGNGGDGSQPIHPHVQRMLNLGAITPV